VVKRSRFRSASRSVNHEGTGMRTNDSTFRVFRVFRGRTLRRFRASLCRNPDFLTPGFVSPRCLCASVVKRSRFRTAPRVGNHGSTRWHTDKGGLGVAAAARRGPCGAHEGQRLFRRGRTFIANFRGRAQERDDGMTEWNRAQSSEGTGSSRGEGGTQESGGAWEGPLCA